MLAPWTRPTKASDAAGTSSTGTRPSSGASGRGSELATTPRSLSVATCQPRSSRAGRGDHHRDHQAQGAEPGPLEQEDQRDRRDPDREGLQIELARVDERVEGPDDAVRPLGVVAGEVGQLAQDDVHADRVDEPDHHGVGHEPQDRPELQEPGRQHDDAGEHREREQGPLGVCGRRAPRGRPPRSWPSRRCPGSP